MKDKYKELDPGSMYHHSKLGMDTPEETLK